MVRRSDHPVTSSSSPPIKALLKTTGGVAATRQGVGSDYDDSWLSHLNLGFIKKDKELSSP